MQNLVDFVIFLIACHVGFHPFKLPWSLRPSSSSVSELGWSLHFPPVRDFRRKRSLALKLQY